MESYTIQNLTFTYPTVDTPALSGINLSVPAGSFITLCGKSGCGKTTLLRLLKPALAPHGKLCGTVQFQGNPLADLSERAQCAEIGFVLQSPENQLVTDKVWHELAFGPESLGLPTPEIRARVAEMASFFGIQTWFHKKVTALSGGQKQLLNLASVMVMQPSVLLLDEPTSQLDPIAAQEFLKTLEKINRELGTTIILSEHRLEDAFPISDRIVVMDAGRIIADAAPRDIGKLLKGHDMYAALPVPMRVFGALDSTTPCPVTVREGRKWLETYSESHPLHAEKIPSAAETAKKEAVIELRDVWFRYEKDGEDVVRGLTATVEKGTLFAIVGGNGAGKTTALSLISGLHTPYRGKVRIHGKPLSEIPQLYGGVLGVLPQNPGALFAKKTVRLDLLDMPAKMPDAEKEARVQNVAALCHIGHLLDRHPYDLSGGEQQRAALAKVLLQSPEILLLDEPTKGMDAHFKKQFARILLSLKESGTTIVMVSHDIEFCAAFADKCAMFFDGNIVSEDVPRAFFSGKSFYTTAANRMARTRLPGAVLAEDIIKAAGGTITEAFSAPQPVIDFPKKTEMPPKKKVRKLSPTRILFGTVFAILFLLSLYFGHPLASLYDWRGYTFQLVTILEAGLSLACFLPRKKTALPPRKKGTLPRRTLLAMLFVLLAAPLTILFGVYALENKKYYFISLLVILETMVPFALIFESRKPRARELIIISVLCALAISGRMAFYMLPQFKPVVALVILAGVAFGGETGFLVGAVTGFVSNFFFGQGPWTPWQMFTFGIIGFLAGILFQKGLLRKTKVSLCLFGGLATFFLYGGIMNPASLLMMQPFPTPELVLSSYVLGAPLDAIHAASTVFFLWFLSEPMLEKLERVKTKYGLIEKSE